MLEKLEVALAVLAATVTAVAAGMAAFGPAVYAYPAPATTVTPSASLWATGALSGHLVLFLATKLGAAVLLAGGALFGSRRATGAGAIALLLGAVVTLPGGSTVVTPDWLAAATPDAVGIGVYFAPAVLLGLVAVLFAAVAPPSLPEPLR